MAFSYEYPHVDLQDVNVDWFLKTFKELLADWSAVKKEWNDILADWSGLQEDWKNYQAELNQKFLDFTTNITNEFGEIKLDFSNIQEEFTALKIYVNSEISKIPSLVLKYFKEYVDNGQIGDIIDQEILDGLKAQVEQNKQNIATNTTDIATNTTNISTNTTNISANASAIGGVKTALELTQREVNQVNKTLQAYDLRIRDNTSANNRQDNSIAELESEQGEILADITSIQQKDETQDTRLTALENRPTSSSVPRYMFLLPQVYYNIYSNINNNINFPNTVQVATERINEVLTQLSARSQNVKDETTHIICAVTHLDWANRSLDEIKKAISDSLTYVLNNYKLATLYVALIDMPYNLDTTGSTAARDGLLRYSQYVNIITNVSAFSPRLQFLPIYPMNVYPPFISTSGALTTTGITYATWAIAHMMHFNFSNMMVYSRAVKGNQISAYPDISPAVISPDSYIIFNFYPRQVVINVFIEIEQSSKSFDIPPTSQGDGLFFIGSTSPNDMYLLRNLSTPIQFTAHSTSTSSGVSNVFFGKLNIVKSSINQEGMLISLNNYTQTNSNTICNALHVEHTFVHNF